jgi:transcriptional regulator with XRE-family HTH domain
MMRSSPTRHTSLASPQATIGHNVRRLRASGGLSQESLASLAGIHRTYLSSVERGERNLSINNVYRIAAALGVDPRELLAPIGGKGTR